VPDRPAPTAQERSAARAELGLPPDAVVGLFLGELSDRKDPLGAIAAARDAGIELLVAGDGPLRGRVEAEQDETTRVLGQRDDPERLIAAADLFVLPSSREGLSLALLEAMAAGRPPVVADGPGNPEAVGEAGIVVPAGDTAALTQALARLRDDPAERERLGGKARECVRTEYSEQRLFDAVRAAYENALA
jgi:glycosyltransferase involved in cell wall biosynthesis